MAVGSGIGSQLGVAPEVTYGTYVAPTRFYEVGKAEVKKVKNTVDWDGLAAGRLTNRADGRSVTTKASTVSIDSLTVTNQDFGLLLNLIMGGTVVPVSDADPTTPAFTATFPLADTAGKMATVQSGVPLIGGTVIPQSALGCKVTSADFSCGVDELLTLALELDGRDLTESQTLAAASYGHPRRPFHFAQQGVKLGTSIAGAAAVGGVSKVDLKIERGIKTDQFYANNAGLKEQPTTNAKVKVSGTISVDYKTAADFADRFRDDTQCALVWEFVGASINATKFDTIRFEVPAIFFDGDTPSVGGPDVVQTDFPFMAYDDLTTGYPVRITTISKDTTL